MKRNINVIEDLEGKKIVVINDIYFKNRQNIAWEEVEEYLKRYIGKYYEILETAEKIYIGKDFADEFPNSKYTRGLRGAAAKAKANAAQGIPELIAVATKKKYKENKAVKHEKNAKYGWYRYYSAFALPVFDADGEVERYNVFRVEIVVRHDADEKMYIYDIINIKKENNTLAH